MNTLALNSHREITNMYLVRFKRLTIMKRHFQLKRFVLLLLISFFFTNTIKATITHPCFANSSCTANDFTLTEVYLASDTFGTRLTTIDCNGILPLKAYYVVRIANSTSSQRLGVYVDARVSIGGVISNLTYCFDDTMPANAIQTLIVPIPIFWDCSAPISITESLIFWSTASGPVCPGNVLNCGPTSPSKCRGGGTFPVNTPLVSNFTNTAVCNPNQGIQTVTYTDSSFGGNYPSVTYLWNFGAGATPATATTKGPHIVTYSSAGTKTVSLTVTNPDGTNDTKTKSIVVGTCCVFSASCPSAPFASTLSCEQSLPAAATTQSQLQALGFTVNACGTLGILSADVRTNGNCSNNYTITRTYTIFNDINSNSIKDANENAQTCVQTITVNDQIAPVITGTPQNTTVSCASAVPTASITSVSATDNCGGIVTVIVNDVITNQTCANRYTITRTWTATDVCGNSSTSSQTITVNDQTAPVITGTPSGTTVSCASAVPAASITSVSATDNCGGVLTVTVNDVITNQTCANRYTITRTWTATDVCGNSSTSSQTITVNDQTAPVITGTPQNTTVSCASAIPTASITSVSATDNCGGVVTVTVTDVITNQTCANRYTITRTWTATDVCGNSSTASQTITVNDQTAPVISGIPQNTTVSCASTVPAANITSVSATDNCGGVVTVTVTDVITNQTCANRYTITRTWTAIDVCGNSSTSTQTITVNDQTAPVITGIPQNTTVSCASAVPAASITSVSATDNCGGVVTVTVNDVITNQTCADRYTITRTWTAIDVCGNSSTVSQTITVNDQTPPTISSTPENTTVSCSTDVPVASITSVRATDNCSGTVTVTVDDVITNQTCANRYTITRAWTATDVCGNSSTSTQTITVNDQTAPVFVEQLPTDITVNCDAVPTAVTLTATDNCGTATVSYDEERTLGNCPNYILTRTWTATDVCGNITIHIQNLTVQDTTRPSFVGDLPQNITVNCDAIPEPVELTSSENCGSSVVTFNEVRTNGNCPDNYILTRTWTATDPCQNSITHVQIVTVRDTSKPVITGVPADITVSCSSEVLAADNADVSATDNCDAEVSISSDDVISNQTCANRYTVTRTWTATDACGNSSTASQTITVNDTIKPVISQVPGDITVSCASEVSEGSPSDVSATDNCAGDRSVTVTVNDVVSNQTCANRYTITRTWTATDACGNSSTASQIITVNDTIKPVITSVPGDVTVSCGSDLPDPGNADVSSTDNCSGEVTLTVADVTNEGNCANKYTVTRTWTATDVCGNVSTASQTITVNDTINPVITESPEDVTVSCAGDVPESSTTDVSTRDNCTGEVTVTVADVISNQTCDNRYTITRTWTATDICGNSSTASQIITVNDTVKPTFVEELPADTTVNCDVVPDAPVLTATDNCSTATVAYNEERTLGNCPSYVLIRTWTATDVCGNTTEYVQHVTVQDTTRPTFSGQLLGDTIVNCDAIPTAGDLSTNDACGSAVITFIEVRTDGNCPNSYILTRTWTATDPCENSISHVQIITVQDTTKPVITGVPQDITVSCSSEIPESDDADVSATDNCDAEVSISSDDVISNQTCANRYTVIRTWTATDACGNSSTASQTITVNDTIKPVITDIPEDVTVSCTSELPEAGNADVSATDNCTGEVTLIVEDVTNEGSCANKYTVTRTWTATDACGNSSTASQTITVNDTIQPVITDVPEDITVSCASDLPDPGNADISATDNCAGEVTLTFEDVTRQGNCANKYTVTRTWTATDVCGNVSTASQTITVNDTINPVITEVPEDVTVSCTGDIPQLSNTSVSATDNCSGEVTITVADETNQGSCANQYTITRTWTATDICGNSSTAMQTITVNDTIKPAFVEELPADTTVNCDVVSEAPVLTATDNCGTASVSYNEERTLGNCPNYILTRTWTASDVCGNTTIYVQHITVQDTTRPTFLGQLLGDTTVNCDAVPTAEDLTTNDGCGSAVITFTEVRTDGNCPNSFVLTRTWTATDPCENTTTHVQIITVQDTTKPEITGVPEDITVSCSSEVPEESNTSVSATDNCDAELIVSVEDITNEGNCANKYSVTRTWTATDACGNVSTASQTITVNDTIKPVIAGVPEDITVSCASEVPESGETNVRATDNCTGEVTLSVEDVVSDGNCANKHTVTRTWTATDACGNISTASQTITVNDTIKPVIIGTPENISVSCTSEVPQGSNTTVTATDNCSGTVTVTVNDILSQNACVNKYTVTRTWTATDACGNSATSSQRITVNDTIKPVITNAPENITVNCTSDIPTAGNASITATDNCSGSVAVTVNDVIANQTCANRYTLTRTWTATDVCGNSSTASQIITVNDQTIPVFTEELPEDATVCSAAPQVPVLTATDNCGTATVTFTESVDVISIPGTSIYTRTWTATDACLNTATHTQVITVKPASQSSLDTMIFDCNGGITIGGQVFVEPGIYIVTTSNSVGCDSLIRLNLRVRICDTVPIGKDTTIYDTLPILTTITECNLSLPPGNNPIEIKSCDGLTRDTLLHGIWILDEQTKCLTYIADSLKGNDTICVLACDLVTHQCNVTTVIITVTGVLPDAIDDCVEETEKNKDIVIDVLANDISADKDVLTIQSIVTQPKYGSVSIDENNQTIVYTPGRDYCGRDTFYYSTCDGEEGCDTAMVCLQINCMCVYPQVITPNNDGFNDHLVFPCLGTAEGAKLLVWHRWGLIVYEDDNYKNDWDGNIQGKLLPAGTYYYSIEFINPESKEQVREVNYFMIVSN